MLRLLLFMTYIYNILYIYIFLILIFKVKQNSNVNKLSEYRTNSSSKEKVAISLDQLNQIRNLVEQLKQRVHNEEKKRPNNDNDDERVTKRLKREAENAKDDNNNKRVKIINHRISKEIIKKEWETLADGLCGFRSLACWRFSDQERYPEVINAMKAEYIENRYRYDTIFGTPQAKDDEKIKNPSITDRLTIEAKDDMDLWFENDCTACGRHIQHDHRHLLSRENRDIYTDVSQA